jgi:Rieske Fe-S protein
MSLSRRHLMGSGAALGLSLPVLAACGGSSGDSGGGGSGGDSESPAAGTTLASTADVPVGGGLIVEGEDGKDGVVITQPEEGTFKAFSARCTHQGCQVTSVDTTINCPCHGSSFALADGAVEGGPAPSPLPEVEITVDGEDITTA